jgi:hypothetical protein
MMVMMAMGVLLWMESALVILEQDRQDQQPLKDLPMYSPQLDH